MTPSTSLIPIPQSNSPLANPADLYLASLGTRESRTSMRGALNAIVATLGVPRYEEPSASTRPRNMSYRYFPWHELRVQHVIAIRAALMDASYAPASINKMLHALHGVMRYARTLRLISRDELMDIEEVGDVPGGGLPLGNKRAISQIEFLRLLDAAWHGPRVGWVHDGG